MCVFSHQVMSDSLQPHGLLHARLPCLSLSLGVCTNWDKNTYIIMSISVHKRDAASHVFVSQ